MKIRLVEMRSKSNNVYDQALLPRLGLSLLGTILREANHDVRIYVETLAPIDLDDLLSADLIGFSTTTGTTPVSYALADWLREREKRVVFGGAHVTFMPDEALLHADYVVRGEGHSAITELVTALESDGDLSAIPGLSYHRGDQLHHNPDRPNCDNATYAALPAPDTTLIVGHERMTTVPIMTQWGCPYGCNFCSVIKMFGRGIRTRDLDDVFAELSAIPAGKEVFFYDDNLVVSRTRTKALLKGMIDRDLNLLWSAQVRADAIYKDKKSGEWDTELLELMRDSQCTFVYIGFESVNPAALEEYHKGQTVDQLTDCIKAFHQYGIKIHGMFVLGCDADTKETIDATVDFAIQQGIDTVQFLTITPFPGTEFYEEVKAADRIITDDWSLYDGHHAVIEPANMTPYELQMASFTAMLRFYNPFRARRLLRRNIRKELPFLLRLLWQEKKLLATLPRVLWLSLMPDRLLEIPDLLMSLLDTPTWLRLRGIFVIPLFRQYAYRHTKEGLNQPVNQQYIKHLLEMRLTPHHETS